MSNFKRELKKSCITVLKYFLLLVILISTYMITMILACKIPTKALANNVKKSSEVLAQEGEAVFKNILYKKERIFTFTDSLMINIAYSQEPQETLASTLLGRRNYIPGQTQYVYEDLQGNLGASEKYVNKKTGDLSLTKELYDLTHEENITQSFEYARYWHGYTAILRPLLVITDYTGIRIILAIATTILVALLLFELYKKLNLEIALAFLIGFIAIGLPAVTQSMNEIIVFLIAIIFSLIILRKKDLNNGLIELFFVAGSVTNFLDLLTAPLVTLCIPLIISILLFQKEKLSFKEIMIKLVLMCFSWGMAYGITWAIKWILVQLVFGRPIISNAIVQAKVRIGIKTRKISLSSISDKMIVFLNKRIILVLISIGLYSLIKSFMSKKVNKDIKQIIPYIIILIFPIIWFLVLKEHSRTHAFFTYRILIISIICIFVIINKLYEHNSYN